VHHFKRRRASLLRSRLRYTPAAAVAAWSPNCPHHPIIAQIPMIGCSLRHTRASQATFAVSPWHNALFPGALARARARPRSLYFSRGRSRARPTSPSHTDWVRTHVQPWPRSLRARCTRTPPTCCPDGALPALPPGAGEAREPRRDQASSRGAAPKEEEQDGQTQDGQNEAVSVPLLLPELPARR